jgi:hypothetical protein
MLRFLKMNCRSPFGILCQLIVDSSAVSFCAVQYRFCLRICQEQNNLKPFVVQQGCFPERGENAQLQAGRHSSQPACVGENLEESLEEGVVCFEWLVRDSMEEQLTPGIP